MTISAQLISDIDKQKSVLDNLRPITSENMLKIRQKFSLEYNYHSNHIEGNSLTIQETYSMLMNSYSPRESKPMRDIDELRGHIKTVDALGLLEGVVKDEKAITESLIRDLNRMILVENFKKRRKDENGDDIFVDIIVGQYKTKPNSVETQTGEMFRFADPSETAPLIHDLINWYNGNKDILHPLELAAIFHYKFIRIHPFDDGNGRVARLLMNLILQNHGYPIIIISSDEQQKKEYYEALMQTDANLIDLHDAVQSIETGSFEPFVSYIGERLLKSLDWTIRGAQGEDISDISDIIKEAKLWSDGYSQGYYKIERGENVVSLDGLRLYNEKGKFYNVDKFMKHTFTPIIYTINDIVYTYFDLFVLDFDLEIIFTGRSREYQESGDIFQELNGKSRLIIFKDNIQVIDKKSLKFIQQIFERIDPSIYNDAFYDDVFQIHIIPNSTYRDIDLKDADIIFEVDVKKASWIFRISGEDFSVASDTLYYKTEPNEDYKDAIKQPLRELSEFLKKKLSE